MNDFDMTNITGRIRAMIENVVDERLARLPISIPARVEARKKSVVSVTPLVQFGTLPATQIEDVPLMKSLYFNAPIQKGDFGLLIPCSYFYQSLVTDGLDTVDKLLPTVTTGNYIFLPLARDKDCPSAGTETELWSKGKSRSLVVKDDRIELGATSGQATEWTALNTALQGFISAFMAHIHTSSGSGGPTSPPTATVSLDISGAKKDTVTL